MKIGKDISYSFQSKIIDIRVDVLTGVNSLVDLNCNKISESLNNTLRSVYRLPS
jgi:hypothetical protein